jgi:hypothetical protein
LIFPFGLCWILPCHRDSFPAHLILVLWHIRSQVCSCYCFSSKQVLVFSISLQLWFVLSLERSPGCSSWKILDPFPTRISLLRDSVLCANKLFSLPCHGLGFRKACCLICRPDSFFSTVLDYCLCFVFLCAVCHQNHFLFGLVLSPARRQESCSLPVDLAPLDCVAMCVSASILDCDLVLDLHAPERV